MRRYSRKFQPDFENSIEGCASILVFPRLEFKETTVHGVAGKGEEVKQRELNNSSRTLKKREYLNRA